MIATDFTRNDCLVGRKRRSYETLAREWRCSGCGGRLGVKWSNGDERYPDDWHVECLACGGVEFVHERQIERQRADAVEVLEGLPPELARQLGHNPLPRRHGGIFSLAAHSIEI